MRHPIRRYGRLCLRSPASANRTSPASAKDNPATGSFGTQTPRLNRGRHLAAAVAIMRICTYKECAEWCAAHDYPTRHFVVGPAPDLTEPNFRFATFSIPEDAGRRVALVKNLVSLLDEDAELLVQIGDWSVWPSGQHLPLFDRFRQAFGERRPLIECPGHLVPPVERDDAISILVLSVLYLWNCYLLSAGGDHALFVSHDQYGWFAVRGSRSLDAANELLEQFGVLTAGPAT